MLAGGNGVSLGVDEVDAVVGTGLAHRARLDLVAKERAERASRLGLAEALVNRKTSRALELREHLGVQRLARGSRVMHRREVVLRDVLFNEHAVHRRRRAESRDAVLREHRENLLGVETREVVDEERPFAHPLAVELAPARLGPARL